MNLPIGTDNRMTAFLLELLGRFKVFTASLPAKLSRLICIEVTCIGTRAKKELKFNLRTMVIYPICVGNVLTAACMIVHGGSWGGASFGLPTNRILYAILSIVGTMLIHQGLDGIAKYYNYRVGKTDLISRMNLFSSLKNLMKTNIPSIFR